ncbi:MAG: hypothetical protein AAF960_20530 [Bacteroidota bacterium]
MDNLSFQYPTWYLFLCASLGLGYALLVYFRSNTFKEQTAWLNWLLGGVRFITATTLAVLLLSPLIKSLLTDTKKPVVILAQDQSESVMGELDETALQAYKDQYAQLKSNLTEKYDLKEYAFGSEVREGVDFSFTDKVSNLSEMLKSLYDLYSNQNLGAVVLASDGIYNEGSNPVYAGNRLGAPIFTVALGDTTPQRDLLIKRVYHNKIAYLGDKFNIEVDILAQNCPNTRTNIVVSKIENGRARTLQQIPVSINRNDFFTTQEVTLDADQAGVQRFRIAVNSVKDEVTTANNVKDIFIDVLDARQKILIVAHSPHPDLTAIKQSVINNKNYEIKVEYIDQLKAKVADYNFIILHQLPGKGKNADALIQQIQTKKLPHLFVVGSQSNLTALNQTQSILTINGDARNSNDVQGLVANDFSLFTIDDNTKNNLPNFAPMKAPFGEFKESVNAQVLLFQRIGKIETKYPLLVLGEEDGMKKGVLAAEGIWKWRLFDYLQHKNHDIFEEVLGKTLQYLSLKEDKRRFRISLDKNIFNENEPIILDAEVYNDNYELINDGDVSLTIRNSEGNEFPSTFNRTAKAYTLNAGIFPVGNYTFSGSTTRNGKSLTYKGQFSVQPVQLESFQTTANHGLLRLLSEQYGGELVYPNNLTAISDKIEAKKSVKPVIYQTTKTRSVINLKWIFFLLMGLLTLEWFMRRYHGSY